MIHHAIALVHAEENAYGISFPDFPGCVSTGGSFDEAVIRGGQALAFHIEGMVEDGDRLPVLRRQGEIAADPAFRADLAGAVMVAVPVRMPGRAVRINVTMDEHLLSALDRAAMSQGSSRSGFLAEAVRSKLEAR